MKDIYEKLSLLYKSPVQPCNFFMKLWKLLRVQLCWSCDFAGLVALQLCSAWVLCGNLIPLDNLDKLSRRDNKRSCWEMFAVASHKLRIIFCSLGHNHFVKG